jgi:hypothetical protein
MVVRSKRERILRPRRVGFSLDYENRFANSSTLEIVDTGVLGRDRQQMAILMRGPERGVVSRRNVSEA